MAISPIKIFMVGVGGQGTLTATTILAKACLLRGLPVTSGEIHGMAQRGGVVESTLLIGLKSPKIGSGEADILLGFDPLETLRALPYLKSGGAVFSSTEELPPLSVSMGQASSPILENTQAKVRSVTSQDVWLPCQSLGLQAGALQAGNIALLGAVLASGILPIGVEALEQAIAVNMPPKIQAINLKALALGAKVLTQE